jgi:hypothetical protein
MRILLRLSSVQTSTLRLMILSNCGETLWAAMLQERGIFPHSQALGRYLAEFEEPEKTFLQALIQITAGWLFTSFR